MLGARGARRALALAALLAAGSTLAQKGDARRGEAKAAPCAACHGPGGATPIPGAPSLAGQPPLFLVLQMVLLREGLRDVAAMAPVMKGLSDRDLEDLAAYFAAQTPAKAVAEKDSTLYERGAALAKTMNCGGCHLPDFRGQKQLPRLAGQREDYLFESLKAYRDDRRTGTDTAMNGILYQAAEMDLRALAHYLSHR